MEKKRKYNNKVDKKKALEMANRGLTRVEIGKQFDVTASAISHLLADSRDEIDVDAYKNNKASILNYHAARFLSHLTDDKLKDAKVKELATAFGILYDKECLETGKSTSNVAYINYSPELQDIERQLAELVDDDD